MGVEINYLVALCTSLVAKCRGKETFSATGGPGVTATNINLNLADTGTHEISYLYTDTTTGCANSGTTQFVVIDCLTISEATELGVSVYPNPADNYITVEGRNLPAIGNVQIRLFDVSAKLVQ